MNILLEKIKQIKMYKIENWCPRPELNGAGFTIVLNSEFKKAVEKSSIKQNNVDNWLKNNGSTLLKNHGFRFNDDELIQSNIRLVWGEWGLEHIQVPGNACGLDIGSSITHTNQKCLYPHNVDTLSQASLLLSIFLSFANYIEQV